MGGILTVLFRRQGTGLLLKEARSAWTTGKHAVMALFLFAMLAELLAAAGISQAFAEGLFHSLNRWAVLVTPILAGVFGILANTGNAPNSLFMPSQLALATEAGLSIPAVAALLHVSGMTMSLFSPVRMSIAAGLSQGRGRERQVYLLLFPYAGTCIVVLTAIAFWVMKESVR